MVLPDSTSDGISSLADSTAVQQVAVTMGTQGWCVMPDFLSPLLISQLDREVTALWESGEFRHAGVGRGNNFEINPAIRTDHVLWLDKDRQSGAQKIYFDAMEQLRLAINHNVFLGLMEFEAHFAVYPEGSYYKKHLDQFRGIGARTVSAVLYLNDHWREEHGGQLRLYNDPQQPERYVDILPHAGTLVTFLSARYLHEVLPANRPRKSITGWFKKREEFAALR